MIKVIKKIEKRIGNRECMDAIGYKTQNEGNKKTQKYEKQKPLKTRGESMYRQKVSSS
jgi:hypothetical protein